MDKAFIIEAIGYAGSALVVVSMLMTSVKKLRLVNTTGSAIFTVYALIIRSYPTAVMNFCLILINIYQLIQLEKKEKHFRIVETRPEDAMLKDILFYYEQDILKFFPSAAIRLAEDCDACFAVVCDGVPAGILLGNRIEDGTVAILIDYATPAYRDTSVGKFLYSKLPEFKVERLVFSSKSVGHEDYMREMGFVKTDRGFVKELRCDKI